MRIDSHQHFWTLSRSDYGWLTPSLVPLYRDFQPADLAGVMHRHDVVATVLVQAAATVAETDYLLRIADRHDFVRGVVGWADLLAPDLETTLNRLGLNPRFKGVRPMLQELPDVAWIAQPELDRAAQALIARDLSFDALVKPPHLPHLWRFAQRNPALRIVIDHGAKPEFGAGSRDAWRNALRPLARLPNVFCKLSGLVTEAGSDWDVERLRPHVDDLLDLFGPRRLMWGSDWPVLELAADYGRWVETSESLLTLLNPAEREAVWSQTANRFYQLAVRSPVERPS